MFVNDHLCLSEDGQRGVESMEIKSLPFERPLFELSVTDCVASVSASIKWEQ